MLPEEGVQYDYLVYVPEPCTSLQERNQKKTNARIEVNDKLCWFFLSGEKQRERLPEGSKLLLDGLDDDHFWFSARPLPSNRKTPGRHPELPEQVLGPLSYTGILEVLEKERKMDYQLMVPHGFDFPSMTTFRSLFEDVLGIPHPGPTGLTNAVLQNKILSRSVLENVPGLKIPTGEVLKKIPSDETGNVPQPSIPLPFVVKPAQEDNSNGVSLCRKDAEVFPAVLKAFDYGNEIIVEEFIPGREIRAGGLEDSSGKCKALSCKIEYALRKDYPIRLTEDKLTKKVDVEKGSDENSKETNSNFTVLQATCDREFLTSDPNDQNGTFLAPEIVEKIDMAICKAHEALGCRDYSLFDFRIHEETGEPYILESCTFWAFAPISMLSLILNRSTELFVPSDESSFDPDSWRRASEAVWRRAINRGHSSKS